jgi:hypothetical protein
MVDQGRAVYFAPKYNRSSFRIKFHLVKNIHYKVYKIFWGRKIKGITEFDGLVLNYGRGKETLLNVQIKRFLAFVILVKTSFQKGAGMMQKFDGS